MIKLKQIIAHQQSENLDDTAFSLRLGYKSRFTWNKVKNGKYPLNDRFLMKVLRAFPDLNPAHSNYSASHGSAKNTKPRRHNFHNTPQASLSQILRPFRLISDYLMGRQGK